MGYDIVIGEAKIRTPDFDEKHDPAPSLSMWAEEVNVPDAPTFPGDKMTGDSNYRAPSYIAWSDFAKAVGLNAFFFNKERGLMRSHPGEVSFTKEHHKVVAEALSTYRASRPNVEPGWCECPKCSWMKDSKEPHVDRDGNLARLIWLEWWMRWALEKCKIPAFCNM